MRLAHSSKLQGHALCKKSYDVHSYKTSPNCILSKSLVKTDHDVHSLQFTQASKCWDIHVTLIAEANILTKPTNCDSLLQTINRES